MRFKPYNLHLYSYVLGYREYVIIFHFKKFVKVSDICTKYEKILFPWLALQNEVLFQWRILNTAYYFK